MCLLSDMFPDVGNISVDNRIGLCYYAQVVKNQLPKTVGFANKESSIGDGKSPYCWGSGLQWDKPVIDAK